jgi:hypothetical protein
VGTRASAGRFETIIEVARPGLVVFAWITEPTNVSRGWGGSLTFRSLTPERNRVGARKVSVMEDRNNDTQRMDIEVETTRHDPDRMLEAA